MIKNLIFLVLTMLLVIGCGDCEKPSVTVDEMYQTVRVEADNIDSPASFYEDGMFLLFATAKEGDKIVVHNATDGKKIFEIGESGTEAGQLERPNGISVVDTIVFVVERDNRRVQSFGLISYESLLTFGEEELIKPYGLYVQKLDPGYRVYVTDNYETATEEVPADSMLGKRVRVYELTPNDSTNFDVKLVNSFGATSGPGVLRIVESIYGDEENDNMLISEEDEAISVVHVYDFEGNYKSTFGKGIFKHQVEGIALYKEGEKGMWIITDQFTGDNSFNLFDRTTFEYLGEFRGKNTQNTDGIWLQQDVDGKNIFFAVHDDGNVSAIDFDDVLKKLELDTYCK